MGMQGGISVSKNFIVDSICVSGCHKRVTDRCHVEKEGCSFVLWKIVWRRHDRVGQKQTLHQLYFPVFLELAINSFVEQDKFMLCWAPGRIKMHSETNG